MNSTVGSAEGIIVRQKSKTFDFSLFYSRLIVPLHRNWFSTTSYLGGVATELRWEWGGNPRHYPML